MSLPYTAKLAPTSAASGALAGAIGASVASGNHPILKGAAITGMISSGLALLLNAISDSPPPNQIQTTASSAGVRGVLSHPRFP